ncbi:hypothetical protein OEZ49_01905 [Ruegeria sp. WL0004]|uniref:Uncharacterized protein n=1 Tax=Ruegeria marisflavi TaxID=2984152 RepID=A0ABT2WKT3_9RHOB|nr:hypothetical protein [Ruegeria sp. WL0004]
MLISLPSIETTPGFKMSSNSLGLNIVRLLLGHFVINNRYYKRLGEYSMSHWYRSVASNARMMLSRCWSAKKMGPIGRTDGFDRDG